MNDRRLRAIGVLSCVCGIAFSLVSLLLYWSHLPPTVTLPVFIGYCFIQYRVASHLFKRIYEGPWIDLPQSLRRRYPPKGGEEDTDADYDVILIRPPSAVLSGPDNGEALGLGYLASVLRDQEWRVRIIDARLMGLDMMQTVELVLAYKTPMLGINVNFQYLAPLTAQFLKALRRRGNQAHITLGGLYASVAPHHLMESMPEVDAIVRFEGEWTYNELVRNIGHPERWSSIAGLVYRLQDGSIQVNPLRPLISDVNAIPHPARDYLPLAVESAGYAYVLSSRGCKGVCAYCVQQCSVSEPGGQRWRSRDPEDVVDEVARCVNDYGAHNISFVDDDFFGPTGHTETHAHGVARALIKRGLEISILLSIQPRDVEYHVFTLLKQAGLESVILAVDNFCQAVLDRYCKFTTVEQNLHSIKILESLEVDAYLGIIMFDPWTSLEELQTNFTVLLSMPYLRPWQILSKLEIYHGSPMSETLEKQGLIKWGPYFGKYEYVDSRIQPVYEAIETIMKICYPSMQQFDEFRWGNFSYRAVDTVIIEHFKTELALLNAQYNRDVLTMASEIVQRQLSADTHLSVAGLAGRGMQRQARGLNQKALQAIKTFRQQAKSSTQLSGTSPPPESATRGQNMEDKQTIGVSS